MQNKNYTVREIDVCREHMRQMRQRVNSKLWVCEEPRFNWDGSRIVGWDFVHILRVPDETMTLNGLPRDVRRWTPGERVEMSMGLPRPPRPVDSERGFSPVRECDGEGSR